jgi:hypothetical protein
LIENLLSEEVQKFIVEHAHDDPASLMLKGHPDMAFPLKEAVEQIESRQKAREKLPAWQANGALLFPPAISMEQCSSEATAGYKAQWVKGGTGADLTGGFGVDSYYFSKHFDQWFYIERSPRLCALAAHNFEVLGAGHIEVMEYDGLHGLENFKELDFIYIDPSRRDNHHRRIFRLEDYSPDVVFNLPLFFSKAPLLMIKISPMFDIEEGLRKLRYVKEVHVVAVRNECKELLFILEKGFNGEAKWVASNIKKSKTDSLRFTKREEEQSAMTLGMPQTYLYEPNAAVMKAGAFRTVAVRYHLKKLHPNSHLYTSDQLMPDFPGKRFKIRESYHPYSRELREWEGKAINLKLRNFPEPLKSLKKRLRIKDGGEQFLIGTTLADRRPTLLLCDKV